MFTSVPHIRILRETTPCHAWADHAVRLHREIAQQMMAEAERAVPALTLWATTPQSAPHHAEGATLADHVCRMLSVCVAIAEGESLSWIEEFAREKDLRLDILALEWTLRTQQSLLMAFSLVHDIAKRDTAFFDAHPDATGAKEGFAQHGMRAERTMTDAERVRYEKLLRAFHAAHPKLDARTCTGRFFDAYGIAVHYDHHDTVAASAAYAVAREAVAQHFGLPISQGKMLTALVRYHIDTIRAFHGKADHAAYGILAARAGKAGLNVDVFLNLAAATLFLDAVAGSLQYARGRYYAQTDLLVHMLRAERDAMPERHARRVQAEQRAAKQAEKALLAAAELDGESVFRLLGTPIGPVRGEVMRRVQSAVDDPAAPLDFGAHTEELRRRVAKVRALRAAR